jgi:hypothetical protein
VLLILADIGQVQAVQYFPFISTSWSFKNAVSNPFFNFGQIAQIGARFKASASLASVGSSQCSHPSSMLFSFLLKVVCNED